MVGTLDCITDHIRGLDWRNKREAKILVNLLPSPHGIHSNKYNKVSSKLKPCTNTKLFNDWSGCSFLD